MTTVMPHGGAVTDTLDTTIQRLRAEVADAGTLALLAARSPDGLVRVAPDGRILDVNPAVERLLGWRPDVLRGRALAALAHPDDRAGIEARLARALTATDPAAEERITCRARRVDARYGWVELALRTEREASGAASAFIAALRDVDERRTAEMIERRRTGEHAALMRIGRAIAAGATGAELDAATADELLEALGPHAVLVHRVDAGADLAACDIAIWRDAPREGSAIGLDAPVTGDGPVARALTNARPVHVDLAECLSEHARGLALMWSTAVSAPIIGADGVEGVISAVYGPDDAPPDDAAGRVLELAAELVGLVRRRH